MWKLKKYLRMSVVDATTWNHKGREGTRFKVHTILLTLELNWHDTSLQTSIATESVISVIGRNHFLHVYCTYTVSL